MKIAKKLVVALLLAAAPAVAQVDPGLLQHWKYDQKLPLNVRQGGVEERGGVKIYDVTYASPAGDRNKAVGPNGGTVSAYLVIPAGKGPFPAVIYGHWCMPGSEKRNRTEFFEEAVVLAQAGVVSLLPDHVSVRPGFVEDDSPFNENQVAVMVQQVVNLRRGADLLLSRADVDAKRIAYVGHSCDASAGGFLSGIDKRFKAFVLMAGDLSDEVDKRSKSFEEYRRKVGPERLDAFMKEHAWLDAGKYVSAAAPATVFLQYASDEPFLDEEMEKGYFEIVSEPKKYRIYKAPHALSAEATRDRIAFLSGQLSFQAPPAAAIDSIPALVQPPWPQQ
jgi:dienelactone hydrolase